MGLTYSDMVIFLSARQYIHLYFMSSYILWNTIRASLYRDCSPFAGLGIVVNLVSRRSNCSQTATYINTVTTLYIYRCTELSKPPAALTYHPIKRILTLLFLASYTSSAQRCIHRSELKGIHSHTKNKNNLGNAFQ